VGHDGLLNLDDVKAVLDERVAIVAVMLVNNEIGVIQQVAEIAALAHRVGALMLCDAVQGLGRVDIPDGPDLVAVSAHKIHGPKAIGALWMREGAEPAPFIHGGGQELGIRSGTLSPALCVGFGAAAKLALERREIDDEHVEGLWLAAGSALTTKWMINGSMTKRYKGNLNVCWPGVDVTRIMYEERDIAFSLGSACASGSGRPSHVLQAIGLSDTEARSSMRLGFGRYTSLEEIIDAVTRIDEAARAQQGLAA
jgi:cysteine desulfurase